MYVIDDVCYAGTPEKEIRVIEAKPLVGGMLLLTFLSGEKRLFDTTTLTGPAFLPLREEAALRTARVQHGFVSWLDGAIDVAPEYIYEHSIPYDEAADLLLAG